MSRRVSAVSHGEQGFVMKQAEEARKEIQLWPAWHRRTLGENQRIFLGEPWYSDSHGTSHSRFLPTVAVVAFTKEDAELLMKHDYIKRYPSDWTDVLWHISNMRSHRFSERKLMCFKNDKDVDVIEIPDEYYHVALGQARWDEEIRNEAKK